MSFLTPAKSISGRKGRQRSIGKNVLVKGSDIFLGDNSEYSLSEISANLHSCYVQAVEYGSRPWYLDAHVHARKLATDHNVSIETVCGIIAALSPATQWERTLELTATMLETDDCSHAFGNAIRKARAIKNGADPKDILGGRKVISFYMNLLEPLRFGHVTIDRHAISLAVMAPDRGRTYTLSDADLKILERPGVYIMFAAAYRGVARELNILPHDLQSILWDWYRANFAHDPKKAKLVF